MEARPTLLPIDECEEWIWEILDSTKDSGFEYIIDEGNEKILYDSLLTSAFYNLLQHTFKHKHLWVK